jgi:segregation and condensation protein B
MSLKAKIEAVIYASEEPVTLAQLVGLLGEEAQAELDAAASAQSELALDSAEPKVAESSSAEDAKAAEEVEAPVDAAESTANAAVDAKENKARERALRDHFRAVLEELTRDYADGDRGLEVREVAGGFRLATKPEYHDAVRGFIKSLKPPLKLSLQALETLAVVAYKQPVTAPEVSEIRGVDSGGVLGGLMTRKLVTTAGRKPVIGRPILYKTTKDFLLRFGLKDINELPSIEEFEKMAGELVDADPVQEEIPMNEEHPQERAALADTPDDLLEDSGGGEANSEVEPMRDVHEAQADGVPEESSEDPASPEPELVEPYSSTDERGA